MALVPFSSRRKIGQAPSPLSDLLGDVSVLERLEDLRKRLVRSALAVAVGVLAGFTFINQVTTHLRHDELMNFSSVRSTTSRLAMWLVAHSWASLRKAPSCFCTSRSAVPTHFMRHD